MPANKKYLTKSGWIRLLRILAGTIGGYAVMFSAHLLLAKIFPQKNVIITSFITGYILWAFLLLWAFICPNVWKVWLVYIALTLLFLIPYFI
ncbi:hypothetical protein [Sphingobacterium hungaricum]